MTDVIVPDQDLGPEDSTGAGRDEHARRTRAALIKAARAMFLQRGYQASSIDAVAAEVHMTKGAVYHHFANKKELFRAAVYEATIEIGLAAGIADIDTWEGDSWQRFVRLCDRALDILSRSDDRGLIEEAGAVLGWKEWRDIESRFGLNLLEHQITQAMTEGAIPVLPVRTLVSFIIAAFEEAAQLVFDADDDEARAQIRATFGGLLASVHT